jgi:hypothetical protein
VKGFFPLLATPFSNQQNIHGHVRFEVFKAATMLHLVTLVRADISEERSASFIRVTRIGELGKR